MSTIQYDFNQPKASSRLPGRRRVLPAAGDDPLAKFGSIERFFGVLVEHYAGAFPLRLAPVQVRAIPVAEAHADYLYDVARRMQAQASRVEVDDSDDRMQKKIRNAQLQKVPFP